MTARETLRGRRLRTARLGAIRRRASRGAALLTVLVLMAMIVAASASALDGALAQRRRTVSHRQHAQALLAADAALAACVRALRAGTAPVLPQVDREPGQWLRAAVLDGPEALTPWPMWPGAARPPQCVIEPWLSPRLPAARLATVTARGFGADATVQSWVQLALVDDEAGPRQNWRRLATVPR
jgi:type II secretory pathway pseudopilin PulG